MNFPIALEEWCIFMESHDEIVLLSLATFLFLFIYNFVKQNRNKVTVNWPIVGMLPTLIANHDHLLDHTVALLQDNGQTMMFRGPWFSGMNFLFTCDPENANHIFNVHFSNYPKGEEFVEIFDVLGDGIFNVDGDSWVAQRRMAHAHMSQGRFRLTVQECTKDKVAKALLPLLKHMEESDKVVDLSDVFMRFTFDTTCTLVLGVDPGCLASEFSTVPFAKAMDHIEQAMLFRHIVPMIWWKLLRWLRLGKEKKLAKANEVVNRFIAQCIQQKRKNREIKKVRSDFEDGPIDLLTPYMDRPIEDLIENSSSLPSTDKFLRDTCFTFLVAGKDTIGTALVWLFWLIANHPIVEKKVFEELKERRSLSEPKEHSSLDDELRVFDAEECDALVYLHAALLETLRLYPPVPYNHKKALKSDVLPSGHKVQQGTRIIFSSYSEGRMERVWGKDCLKFKPERWITQKGTLRHEPSYKFMAFHSGPRSCLGKSMAITQTKMVAAAVIYNFDIEVVEGHIAQPKVSVVMQTKNGLLVKLKKKQKSGG